MDSAKASDEPEWMTTLKKLKQEVEAEREAGRKSTRSPPSQRRSVDDHY